MAFYVSPNMSRRQFLIQSGVMLASTMMLPRIAQAASSLLPDRFLTLYNAHTDEWFKGAYWSQGAYIPESLKQINHLLRDNLNHQEIPIDPRLLDLMQRLYRKVEARKALEIICGYRSIETNNYLRQISTGVAQHSLHMTGKAVDLRIEDVKLAHLRDAAKSLKLGGVGYYPRSNFIHVDIRPQPCFW